MTADDEASKVREPESRAAASHAVDIEQIRPILPSLIDSLTDAVLVVDRHQRIVAANRRYLQVFGIHGVQVARSVCRDVLHCPEDGGPGPPRCAACEVLKEKVPLKRLRNWPDPTGAQRRWEATFSPILDEAGEVSHVVEVWRDITERSQLEFQISHNERLAALGILAAGVGHEINNPLASVMAGIESLSRWLARAEFDQDGTAEAAEVLQLLEREIGRCRETTDKLMLLAQPYSLAAAWVDLNKVLRDTLSLMSFETRRRGIAVVEELERDLPVIWARDTGMRSVCMNLMMNAVQAMEGGGTLRVVTRRNGSGVVMTIEDTGPGIAPEHLDRIWNPFFTTKPIGQGTGLGLAITNRIVVRHGGSVRVESQPGRGARFLVELPVAGAGGSDV